MGSIPDDAEAPAQPDDNEHVARLMRAASAGDSCAAGQLLPLVYDRLRAIAQQRMRAERAGHTLQATALVHEAYLRLVGDASAGWSSRAQFFYAAAEAMRRILIEHARRRDRIKRGGGRRRLPLDVLDLAVDDDAESVIAIDAAIAQLQARDPHAADVVRLRFYAGLSVPEVAAALGTSERSVKREWAFARAWLFQELWGGSGE